MRLPGLIWTGFLLFCICSTCYASKGVVVKEHDDEYLIALPLGYTLVELYGGFMDEGDYIIGDLESYGFKDCYNATKDLEIRVYVDEYWLDWEDALEHLYD